MPNISDKKFVEAWIAAYKAKSGLKKLAEDLGVEYTEATQHASRLRRAGVKLPTMPHANQKHNMLEVDIKPLNKLITDQLGEQSMRWRTR